MYCSNCGAQCPDNSCFCPTCGATQSQQGAASPYGTVGESFSTANIPDYLVWNILATILCCLPFGIVGIVYSAKVNGAKARGDYQAAKAASSTAKIWLIVAVVCGVLSNLFVWGMMIIGAAAENGSL